jgi:hypothetical protein
MQTGEPAGSVIPAGYALPALQQQELLIQRTTSRNRFQSEELKL